MTEEVETTEEAPEQQPVLTKPTKPKVYLPLDPNVVGKDAVAAAETANEEAQAAYEEQLAAYEADNPPEEGAAETAGPEPNEAVRSALDALYNTVHVPDKAAVVATIETALAAPPPEEAEGDETE